MMHNFAKAVLEILYPLECGGCRAPGSVLCADCISVMKTANVSESCPVCGRWTGRNGICGTCMEEDRGFQRGFYGYSFEGRVRDAIHSFKFEKRKDVGRCLTRLIGEKIVSLRGEFDCIVPVPVTEARLKSRGFNQSFIIAEEIGGLAERPVLHSVLFKTRDTEDQYTLDRKQRERNVRDAFAVLCDEGLKGKTVLLVDDLLTTGSTAKAATRALLGSDVKEVIFFALARTPS